MDLDWLRTHPQQLAIFLTHQRIRVTPVPGGDTCKAERLTLDDGAELFAKTREGAPADFFAAEAAGLRWLGEAAGGATTPEVVAVASDAIAMQWLAADEPSTQAAETFGRELARTHAAGAMAFGTAWPGYIGRESLENGSGEDWTEWFTNHRILPYLRISRDRGAIGRDETTTVERAIARLEAPPEPISRIHGDLHPGNVVWSHGHGWLIDPAAQGGHRETDLATLALFGGAPNLDRTLAAYQEISPLAEGWQERIGIHQLHLLLVHTVMFGAAYASAVRAAASR